ncbi:peptidase, S8/S53 family [Leptospira inadai serovar Lyme str. 10]|uniref:Peptidase, S8/S53 family n=1 Tax=Leptospira inadai serovar Lyme str. 10 TaxID=1049790 RepID=V6HAA9_9LEPT|nr:peptidase, S8/S53 family [Leptospira inadai serovar Lyme str. 10]
MPKALLFKTLAKQVWNYLAAYYSKKHDPEITVTVVDRFVYLQDQSLEYKRVSYNNNVTDLSSFALSALSHGSMVASLISDRVTGAAPGTLMIIRNLIKAPSLRQEYRNWISMWIDVLTEEDPIVTVSISFGGDRRSSTGEREELQKQYYEKISLIGQKNKSVLVSAVGNLGRPMDEVCEESTSPDCYDPTNNRDRVSLLGEGVFKNEKWIQAAEETGYPMHCAIQGLLEPTVCQLVRKEGSPLADDAEECDPSDQTGSRQKRGTGYQKADCEFTSGAKALLFKTLAKQVWNYLAAYYSKKHDPEITVTVVDRFVYLQDQSLEYKRVSYNNNVTDLSSFALSALSHGSMVASLISDRVTGAAPGTLMIIRNLIKAPSLRQEYRNWISMWIDVLTEEDPIVTVSISFGGDRRSSTGEREELQKQYYEKISLIGQKNKSVLVSAVGNLGRPMDEVCEESTSPDCYDPTNNRDRVSDPLIRVASLSEGSLGTGQIPQLAHFSNFGAGKIDIAAPGVNILVNRPDMNPVKQGLADRPTQWKIEVGEGTSYSAPLVAATLVQMKKCQPNATAQQLKAALLGNADKIDSLRDKVTEGRVLNSVKAISVFCAGREEL